MNLKINFNIFRNNLIKIIKKTFLLNVLIAIISSSLIFYKNFNNRSFEHTIEIKLSKRVFNIYNLFVEDHVNEIFYIIEQIRKSHKIPNSKLIFIDNKLRKGAKISWDEGFSNLFLENRFHGVNYNKIVNDYFDEFCEKIGQEYKKSVSGYIMEEENAINFFNNLNDAATNPSIIKKIQAKQQRIKGLYLIKNSELNYIKHYSVNKKFNFILPTIVAFLFSISTFIFLLGVYNIGNVSLKNLK